MRFPFILLCIAFAFGCTKFEKNTDIIQANMVREACTSSTCALDRVYQLNTELYLWGGEDTATHFNITNWLLDKNRLRDHGLTRESFDALIQPRYSPVSEVGAKKYKDSEEVICVKGHDGIHAYPISLMTFHEVVNSNLDGHSYMVSYCVLADFVGVYDRIVCDQKLTYAVSGYTYMNPSLGDDEDIEAFILWDRDTESLWNPLNNMAVSSVLNGTSMVPFTKLDWEIITWKQLSTRYPNALVLKSNQSMEAPSNWSTMDCGHLSCCQD